MPYEVQATKQEIAENKRRCWNSSCKKTAIVEVLSGDRYCLKHFIYYRKYGGYFAKMRKVIWGNIFK